MVNGHGGCYMAGVTPERITLFVVEAMAARFTQPLLICSRLLRLAAAY